MEQSGIPIPQTALGFFSGDFVDIQYLEREKDTRFLNPAIWEGLNYIYRTYDVRDQTGNVIGMKGSKMRNLVFLTHYLLLSQESVSVEKLMNDLDIDDPHADVHFISGSYFSDVIQNVNCMVQVETEQGKVLKPNPEFEIDPRDLAESAFARFRTAKNLLTIFQTGEFGNVNLQNNVEEWTTSEEQGFFFEKFVSSLVLAIQQGDLSNAYEFALSNLESTTGIRLTDITQFFQAANTFYGREKVLFRQLLSSKRFELNDLLVLAEQGLTFPNIDRLCKGCRAVDYCALKNKHMIMPVEEYQIKGKELELWEHLRKENVVYKPEEFMAKVQEIKMVCEGKGIDLSNWSGEEKSIFSEFLADTFEFSMGNMLWQGILYEWLYYKHGLDIRKICEMRTNDIYKDPIITSILLNRFNKFYELPNAFHRPVQLRYMINRIKRRKQDNIIITTRNPLDAMRGNLSTTFGYLLIKHRREMEPKQSKYVDTLLSLNGIEDVEAKRLDLHELWANMFTSGA